MIFATLWNKKFHLLIYRQAADPRLETLGEVSHGKTYTVKDSKFKEKSKSGISLFFQFLLKLMEWRTSMTL